MKGNPVRIGMVTAHRYPTPREVRLTKMAATLTERGHKCHIFCPADVGDRLEDVFVHGRISRRAPRGPGPLAKLVASPFPANLIWVAWLAAQFRRRAIDTVIVRDLRLGLPAIWAARRTGAKAILDMAEHYPGLMRVVSKPGLASKFYRQPTLITWLERETIRRAHQVWVVCEENAARLRRYHPRIEVISNFPLATEVASGESSAHRAYQFRGEPVVVISFGLINEIRGLDLAIDAFALLVRAMPNTRLVIFGDGPTRPILERQVRSLHLSAKVEFRGFIPPPQRYRAMSEGDIGIIFHRVCELTQHTMPNKLFDYMSVGLPIVATRLSPVGRVLELEACGMTVEETPRAAAEGLRDLILQRDRRRAMGENGRRAVQERYVWERQAEKMEQALKAIKIPCEVPQGN